MSARCPSCQRERQLIGVAWFHALAFWTFGIYALATVSDYRTTARLYTKRMHWADSVIGAKQCVYYPPPADTQTAWQQDTVRRGRR